LIKFTEVLNSVKQSASNSLSGLSQGTADTFAWLSIIVMNCATIPSLLAVKAGLSDKLPSLDMTLLLWAGLLLYFIRSTILKDMLMVVTIGVGFAIQAVLLGLIFFL
jgi:hypothetical protein